MFILGSNAPQDHDVRVRYGDGVHSFRLALGTTLGDLAVRVDGLDRLHGGAPLAIEVVVAAQSPNRAPPTWDNNYPH